ncbi:hypothetical protein BKA67DRAFT_524451 [Truncatella angustata]|uniref:Peptidase C14 caspase domain-containing protein n=1 Tax=Truncatella angustata TaxID=152316 RepID=A0A9P8UD14_9PEZI|nr:uncharacterized protein BKA67DRAFT_524451 [Truncatella angustata]KAH6646597.1 hypothetical protein BKA67DRAFT_524451 [Truncatella angustata]
MDDSTARYFAILIGVNFYPAEYSSLHGCVGDVEQVAQVLSSAITRLHLHKFTASSATDAHPHRPPEDREFWPTYHHVMSSFEQVSSLAKTGDYVYVHYSGHGTTTPSVDDSSGSFPEDLALVLLEEKDAIGIRYLRGAELANCLKHLADKGLIITLVLDCCFSGGVMRDGELVRYLPYDHEVDKAHLSAPGPPSRDASMRLNWLVDPDGYCILTACGPTETARELIVKGGQRHGALSYFLLRTLAKFGGIRGRQEHIYHHLCARFRGAIGYKQTPMFYGNKSLGFFGHIDRQIDSAPIPVIKMRNGVLQLQAGQAHGITEGDEFIVYQVTDMDVNFKLKKNGAIASIANVRAFDSELKLFDGASARVDTGWMATALTCLRMGSHSVEFDDKLISTYPWATDVDERRFLGLSGSETTKGEESVSFFVISTKDGYEIQNHLHETIVKRAVGNVDRRAASQLLDELEHAAKFGFMKKLSNEASSSEGHPLSDFTDIQLVNEVGHTFNPGCLNFGPHHTASKNSLSENQVLYLHVYNLSPSYEVENILNGDYLVVPARVRGQGQERNSYSPGTCKKKIQFNLPIEMKEQGLQECEDIIKVFLTTKPVSFLSLELPKLGERVEHPSQGEARGQEPNSVSDDWIAVNFRIKTKILS